MKKAESNQGKPASFEEALRQKLDAVDAAPKNRQWERLETGLDQHKFKKNNRKFQYAIAATLLLLLVAGSVLFLNNQPFAGLAGISQQQKPAASSVAHTSEKPDKQPQQLTQTAPHKRSRTLPATENSASSAELASTGKLAGSGQPIAQQNSSAGAVRPGRKITAKHPAENPGTTIAATVVSDTTAQTAKTDAKANPAFIARNRKTGKTNTEKALTTIAAATTKTQKPALIASEAKTANYVAIGRTGNSKTGAIPANGKTGEKPVQAAISGTPNPVIAATEAVANQSDQPVGTASPETLLKNTRTTAANKRPAATGIAGTGSG